jgi:hypothetical protein
VHASVAELVRVAKSDLFLTIAMKRSGFDPPPPFRPKIHLTVNQIHLTLNQIHLALNSHAD